MRTNPPRLPTLPRPLPQSHLPPLRSIRTCSRMVRLAHLDHPVRLDRPALPAECRGDEVTPVSSLSARPRPVPRHEGGRSNRLSLCSRRWARSVIVHVISCVACLADSSCFLILQVVDGTNAGGDSNEMNQIAETLSSPTKVRCTPLPIAYSRKSLAGNIRLTSIVFRPSLLRPRQSFRTKIVLYSVMPPYSCFARSSYRSYPCPIVFRIPCVLCPRRLGFVLDAIKSRV